MKVCDVSTINDLRAASNIVFDEAKKSKEPAIGVYLGRYRVPIVAYPNDSRETVFENALRHQRKLRDGEIATVMLKHMLCEGGVTVSRTMDRRLGNIAKQHHIPIDELREFAIPILQEVVAECLKKSSIKIV